MYYQYIDVSSGQPIVKNHVGNPLAVILKNAGCSPHVEGYRYLIEMSFLENISKMFEVARWCEENTKHGWLVGIDTSAFSHESDFIAFKLQWL